MLAIIGDTTHVESMLAFKDLMNALGCSATEHCMDGTRMETTLRNGYLFNLSVPGAEAVDACLVVGANPRMEAPLLNTRLPKAYLKSLMWTPGRPGRARPTRCRASASSSSTRATLAGSTW